MAEKHWIGASGGTWSSDANWSNTQGGASSTKPAAGDDVFIDKSISVKSYINVDQDIGEINSLTFTDYSTVSGIPFTVGWYLGGGSVTSTGTTWNLPSNITINTADGTSVYGILNMSFNPKAGGSTITKTGGGGMLRYYPSTGSWGATNINLQAGYIGGWGSAGTLGTGTITMSDGTGIVCSSTDAYSLNPTLVVNGNITLNSLLDANSFALGALTLTGTVNLGSSQRTLTCGGTGSAIDNTTTISGVVSGTGGFVVEGDPTGYVGSQSTIVGLRLTNTGNTISGPVVVRHVLEVGTYAQPPATNGNAIPSVSNIELDGTDAWVRFNTNTSMTTPTFSGTGNVVLYGSSDVVFTCPSNAFSNLDTSGALYGLWLVGGYALTVDFLDLPSKVYFDQWSISTSTLLRYVSTSGVGATFNTSFILTERVSGTPLPSQIVANGSAGSSITLTGTISRGTGTQDLILTGTNLDSNAISGIISTALSLTKSGIGKWILSGTNTYTGTTTISAGTLSAQSNSAFGSSASGVVSQTGGTIEVTGGVTLNKGSLAWTLISASGASSLKTSSGTNSITCGSVTLSSTIIVEADSGASLTINNSAAMSGTGFGITKIGAGEIGLGTFANTYTGAITVSVGTLTVENLQNTSTASSLGTGAGTSAISLTGTLKYVGTGHSTNRSITFTGSSPSLDASGSGAVTYSACTQSTGPRTITFTGTSTASNTFSAALSDGTGVVSIAKSGAGKWILSNGTLNYTGVTTVNEGTLNLNEVPRTLVDGIVINGGTLENGTAVVTVGGASSISGGTTTAVLGGSANFTITTGATSASPAILQPNETNSNNSLTGTVTVNGEVKIITSDALELSSGGNGMVLGSGSTVTVSSTGVIKTKHSGTSSQRGRVRYKNLTLQSGSTLKLGYT